MFQFLSWDVSVNWLFFPPEMLIMSNWYEPEWQLPMLPWGLTVIVAAPAFSIQTWVLLYAKNSASI